MGFSQNCDLSIAGTVTDEDTQEELAFANVILQEIQVGTSTDDAGLFLFENVCPGEYHLIISHIGCEPVTYLLNVTQDTQLVIHLEHTNIGIDEIVVDGEAFTADKQPKTVLKVQAIEDNLDQSLAGLLEGQVGVSALKNGGGISKPIVQGLYGNRLTILNNGIPQSGQQWGNDHSPEIDAQVANRITVIKGTNAIEYAGGSLGAIVMVEPEKIGSEPHLHGRLGYTYESNGRGHNANLKLQRRNDTFAWRINGTLKKYGDRKSSSYYLNNTGIRESNLAMQLEKAWTEKTSSDLYISTFNTSIGVLRGSHIGNLTDLNTALTRDVPFFTEEDFSYEIDAPRQQVGHHLIKGHLRHFFDDSRYVNVIVAGQINDRKEYDVRRSGRSDIPALSLRQLTLNTDISYTHEWTNSRIKLGNQTKVTDNTNNPETGILPLIPDYAALESGFFFTFYKKWNRLNIDIGTRYDLIYQNVATISASLPRSIVRYENTYHNGSGALTLGYPLSDLSSLSWSGGYTMRSPAINELYSAGLHQGVSGIEEGRLDIGTEKSFKTTIEHQISWGTKHSLHSQVYYQYIDDFIYLQPQEEIRLTIRGAFPVFQYQQIDARIYGADVKGELAISDALVMNAAGSYIKGDNISDNVALINIPATNVSAGLTYRVNRAIQLAGASIDQLELDIDNRYTFRQSDITAEQDFTATPDAYNLINLSLSANVILSHLKFRTFVKVDNLLNTQYRNYLNRLRYFADDQGVSVRLGVSMEF